MLFPDRDALFARYQHLVRVIARAIAHKCPPDVELCDLEQVGSIGLLEALERYDPTRDETFHQLVRLLIRRAIIAYLRERDGHEQLDDRQSPDRAAPDPPLEQRIELSQALAALDPIERYVISCLYWQDMPADYVGLLIGHSGRWVREIETGALERLGTVLGGAESGPRRALRIMIIALRRKNL